MGVTIQCKKTGESIDMGAFGFLHLRRQVSDLCGDPWASHYRTLTDGPCYGKDEAWFDEFDKTTDKLLNDKCVSIKVVDFLLQSDTGGAIRYGACKEILKVIGDYDDGILYGYAGRPDCAKFADFKRLLAQCVENKCNLIWW